MRQEVATFLKGLTGLNPVRAGLHSTPACPGNYGSEAVHRAHTKKRLGGGDTSPLRPQGTQARHPGTQARDAERRSAERGPRAGEGPPAAAPRAPAERSGGPTRAPGLGVRSGETRAARRGKGLRRLRRALVERSEDRPARGPAR